MAFLEDPRLRQRWNQITHDAETVTENAAAGIFTFQQNYINPCFASITDSVEQCTTVCLGDPEERLRRKRERQRARDRTEFSFDFYDDWYQEEQGGAGGSGGILGNWGGEDWDRLLAGTGSVRHPVGETTEQPRRNRGMSYGTRGAARRKASKAEDPTIIPRTQPLGFLSKLPWRMGSTLRYKPSAADLQDRPGKHDEGEAAPLLDYEDDELHDERALRTPRQRSGTTGSGATSDSYRSRGDLFPSDGEGEEDAVPLEDDVTYDMVKRDDTSSGKTRRSKGKRPAAGEFGGSRTVSGSTLGSATSAESLVHERTHPPASILATMPSMEDLHAEEEQLRKSEDEKLAAKKAAAQKLASDRGLIQGHQGHEEEGLLGVSETKSDIEVGVNEILVPPPQHTTTELPPSPGHATESSREQGTKGSQRQDDERDGQDETMAGTDRPPRLSTFHAARLPRFG